MKKLDSKGIDRLPTGTKLFTIICLAWALIVSLVPIVWLVLSSLKEDPLARPGFMLPESISFLKPSFPLSFWSVSTQVTKKTILKASFPCRICSISLAADTIRSTQFNIRRGIKRWSSGSTKLSSL